MEHLLILTTVERIGDTLPFSPPSQRRRGAPREYLKEYINTLNDVAVLPQIPLDKVIQPLIDLYRGISKTPTKGCKTRYDVLKRMELVYESKLIILNLFSDYLNFAVPDKSKSLLNIQHSNLFYEFDADDLSIEEQKDSKEEDLELEQLVQLMITESNKNESEMDQEQAKTQVLRALRSARSGSLVKRKAETTVGEGVKPLDDSVAQSLAEVVMTRLMRGYDIGEEHPEHVINIVERFPESEVNSTDVPSPNTSSSASTSLDSDVDPYQFCSRNNIEVFRDSELRYFERRMRYKCQEILFKLSLTNFACVFSQVEAGFTGASSSTSSQLMEQELQLEADQDTELLNQAKQEAISAGNDASNVEVEKRIPISKDDRVPFDERFDVSNGLKILQVTPYMNWTFLKITDILTAVSTGQGAKNFTKYLQEYDICNPLKQAIWNWMYFNPQEVKQLHQNGKSPPGAAELFDLLFAFQKGKKDRKPLVAPLMTTLLCICGDKLAIAVRNSKSDNFTSFLQKTLLKTFKELKKKIKEKLFAVTVLECFVDIYRFSTIVDSSLLSQIAIQVEEGLKDILINSPGSVGKSLGISTGYQDVSSFSYISPEREVYLTTSFIASLLAKDMNGTIKTIIPKLLSATGDDAFYKKLALAKAVLVTVAGVSPKHGSHRDIPTSADPKFQSLFAAVANDFKDSLESAVNAYSAMHKGNQIVGHQQDFFSALQMYDASEVPTYYSSGTLKKKRIPSTTKGFYFMNRSGLAQVRTKYQVIIELASTILHVFCAEPSIFLFKGKLDQEKSMLLLANTFVSLKHSEVQSLCIRFFFKLLLDQYVRRWLPEPQNKEITPGIYTDVIQLTTFSNITSSVLSRLSRALFEEQNTPIIKKIITVIRWLTFQSKMFFIRNREYLTSELVNDQKRLNTLESLESNVLVSLCSPDKDIWRTTNRCFRDICDQIELLRNEDVKALNYSFYRQLSTVDLHADDVAHERRRQMQLFRRIEVQSSNNIAAFNEVFRLWRELIKVPNANNDEWRDKLSNYTSLLCSLGGVCIQQSASAKTGNQKNALDAFMSELMEHVTSSDALIRQVVTYSIASEISPALYEKLFHHMYINMKTQRDSADTGKAFRVTEQYIYIVKTIVESKDATFDLTLATDLDRLLVLILQFVSMQRKGSAIKKTSAPSTPTRVDSNVSSLRSGSMLDLRANSETPRSDSSDADNETDEPERVQCKLKLALLMESVMKKSEYISFDNEQAFRKQALSSLMKWTSYHQKANKSRKETSKALSPSSTQQPAFMSDKQTADLDLNCMRAISALLAGYQIDNDSEPEFSDYFQYLSYYLEIVPKNMATFMLFLKKALNALLFTNVGFALEFFMTMVYSKDEHIRSTFLALLGLLMKRRRLDNNDDDDEDDEEEKKSDQTDNTTESPAENIYTKIVNELFLAYHNRPVFILFDQVKSNDKDDACDAFIPIYQSLGYRNLLNLLELSVQLEVNNTSLNQPGTLFRANSTASKLMKKYCGRVALPYLQDVLGPLMAKVCINPKNFEVDPNKCKPDEDVNVNIANTKRIIQEFIDNILNNKDAIPYQFREYCRFLYKYVSDKFQMEGTLKDYELDYSHIAVGGFLFLRLICPAVTSPQQYGLSKDLPGNDARRFAIIITKVLQNIANGIFESKKEPFMAAFEQFTIDNLIRFKKFFEEMAVESTDETNVMNEVVTDEELEDAHGTMHRYLSDYAEATRPNLQVFYQTTSPTAEIEHCVSSTNNEPSAYDVLSTWLEKAGKPPEKKKPQAKSANDKQYSSVIMDQFLQKVSAEVADKSKNTLSMIEQRHIFFVRGMTKKGEHIVYFLPQRLTAADLSLHTDILLYHIITTMAKIFQQSYVLVTDCTLWEPQIEIPFSILVKLMKILPKGAKKNLKGAVIINPNSIFKKLLKKFNPMLKKMHNITLITTTTEQSAQKWDQLLNVDVDKSAQLMASDQQQKGIDTRSSLSQDSNEPDWDNILVPLPPHTLNLHSDALQYISGIQRVSAKLVKDIHLTITKDSLFVTTLKEKCTIGQKQVSFNRVEHFHLDGISDLEKKKAFIGKSKDFQFKYNPNVRLPKTETSLASTTVVFRHNDRDKLMQTIEGLSEERKRENMQRKMSITAEHDTGPQKLRLRPSDVPGQLLNICFLNLESSNSHTRYAAYNLLTSLIDQFNLPIHGILESDIISVPRNTEDLVLEMSELVAKHKPDITLEFLNEALNAFTQIEPKSQVMCAKYMKPWIHNLSLFYSDEKEDQAPDKKEDKKQQQSGDQVVPSVHVVANSTTHKKLSDWFLTFTRISCRSAQVFPAIAELWTLISQENQYMLYMGLEAAIQYGVEMGSVGADESLVNDLVVTLSVHCPKEENFALRIIQSIMDALLPQTESTDTNDTKLNIYELIDKEPAEIYADKKWSKVIIYLRFLLNLSFQNRLDVVQNAPYLLNLIVILVGLGSDLYIRSTLHGLCCNMIHSLLVELPFLTSSELNKQKNAADFTQSKQQQDMDKRTAEAKMNVMNNAKKLKDRKSVRSIFMGSASVDPDPFAKLSPNNKKMAFDVCNMNKFETLVRFLIDTMSNWTDHWNGLWKVEWEKLCTNILLHKKTSQQCTDTFHIFYSRAFMTYCILTTERPEFDDEIEQASTVAAPHKQTLFDLYEDPVHQDHVSKLSHNMISSILKFLSVQNIQNLMPSTGVAAKDLSAGAKQKQQQDLILCTTLTLGRYIKKLKPRSDPKHMQLIERSLFAGIILLAITDGRIFNSVLRLMSVIFSSLFESGALDNSTNFSHYINEKIRSDPEQDKLWEEFEKIVGISFKQYFSFAISLLVMKALVVESTRDNAVSLLKQLHMMQNKLQWHSRESLGYFCGLIPFDRQYTTASFCEAMFQKDVFYHEQGTLVFLYQKYLFALVSEIKDANQSAANEQAMLSIYRTLNKGFDSGIRSLFNDVFKDHHSMSHVVKSYTSSENDKVIEACMSLFKSMSNDIRGTALSMKEPFEPSGFPGFKKHRNFSVVNVTEVQKLVVPCQELFARVLQSIANNAEAQLVPDESATESQVVEHHRSKALNPKLTTATSELPKSTRKKSVRSRFASDSTTTSTDESSSNQAE